MAADYCELSGPDWYGAVGASIARQADGSPWVAVLHSGAGGFAPAIASAATDLAGLIFLDAILPYPGCRWLDTAPANLAERLRRLASEGKAPRWNRWFEPDPMPKLIPDPEARAAFIRDLPAVPIGFLEAVSPIYAAWERQPAAYVQLSQGYGAEVLDAEIRGWPVRRVRMHHLAMCTDAARVAELLIDLPMSPARP
jgi:hypothetical protein